MFRSSAFRDLTLLLLVCAFVFWWRLGGLGLIDPDEPFYAQTAHEMVASGDWITPRIFGQPQFEKPIFFYWLSALCFSAFGESEFSARIPSALPATLLVFLVYGFGVSFAGQRVALLSGLVLATGLEFAIMSRLMLTDIVLALFLAGALFSYWMAREPSAHRQRWLLLHFLCGGLAVLTKGPVASVVTLLAVGSFAWRTRQPLLYRGRALWIGLAVYGLLAVPWFAVMLWKYGYPYFDAFFIHENFMRLLHAEHPANNHWYYYLAILALGSIPWLPPLAAAALRSLRTPVEDRRLTFLWCWVCSSTIFLTFAQSKLPTYIFFLFAPLALVIGMTLDQWLTSGFRSAAERRLVFGLALFQCLVALLAPFIKVARPFSVPALLTAACLGLGAILLWRGQWRAAIAAQIASSLALLGGALSFSLPNVEAYSSARPVARAMAAEKSSQQPLLASKFLARGLYYYTGRPIFVLASKAQPFWTPHPLPVVSGRGELETFLATHGAVWTTIRRSEWLFWKKCDAVAAAGEPVWYGDNAVIQLRPIASPPAGHE